MKFIARLLLLFTMCITLGCQLISYQKKDYPYELLLNAADLPDGYVYSDSDFPEIDGGKSIEVYFKRDTGELGTSIIHQIYIYTDEQKATQSFYVLENELFFDEWKVNSEIDYQPNNFEDKINISCVPIYSSSRDLEHCILLQQHKNLIFTISVVIDNNYLNLSEFSEIANVADGKLSDEIIPMPND
ncbi:MAG: hypothetical protein JEZ00_11560 [Anaerolineaceae bacterium]|nr:hypothetical protein [Anaerolineaceae bacterium]